MKVKTLILFAPLLALGSISTAQSLTGVWKGTSLCQVKNSPCHDENVVYHISNKGSANSYQVDAGKIIDGKEDHMGIMEFTFDPKLNIFFLADSVRQSRWEFKVTGKEMHGTLVSKGNLYRIVDLKKED